jgi:hypothetical protein
MKILIAVIFTVFFLAAPASAAQPQRIGTFGHWESYTVQDDSGKVCYLVGQPTKSEGKYDRANRGKIFALVTHRPSEKSRNVFSFVAGYSYASDANVTLTIDGKSFTLFTQDDTAWAQDESADVKIVTAIRKGSKMMIKGTSSRGTQTTDIFDLKGSGGALDSIAKACPK